MGSKRLQGGNLLDWDFVGTCLLSDLCKLSRQLDFSMVWWVPICIYRFCQYSTIAVSLSKKAFEFAKNVSTA